MDKSTADIEALVQFDRSIDRLNRLWRSPASRLNGCSLDLAMVVWFQ
jgi:hypothetical protein